MRLALSKLLFIWLLLLLLRIGVKFFLQNLLPKSNRNRDAGDRRTLELSGLPFSFGKEPEFQPKFIGLPKVLIPN